MWSVNDGSGTNLSTSDIGISVSKLDSAMFVTLTNNHATLDGFMTVADIRGIAVGSPTPVTIIAQDLNSKFGLLRYPDASTPRYFPSTAVAQEWADWKLSIFKTPVATTRISGNPRRSLLEAHKWLRRDVSDRITQVSEGSQTKLGINQDMYVEAVRLSFGDGRKVEMRLELSDAAQFSDGWIVGKSLLGASTKVMRS